MDLIVAFVAVMVGAVLMERLERRFGMVVAAVVYIVVCVVVMMCFSGFPSGPNAVNR